MAGPMMVVSALMSKQNEQKRQEEERKRRIREATPDNASRVLEERMPMSVLDKLNRKLGRQ